MAVLLLSAAIVFVVSGPVFISDVLGWSGLVCFHLCVFCGLRYRAFNGRADSEKLTGPELGGEHPQPPGSP
jgi:hypothetical protein